jgi:holo-[acyl-carrier protein] synthase
MLEVPAGRPPRDLPRPDSQLNLPILGTARKHRLAQSSLNQNPVASNMLRHPPAPGRATLILVRKSDQIDDWVGSMAIALTENRPEQIWTAGGGCPYDVWMIIGTGVDIAEVPRIRESIERYGDRFLHRIFTEGEIRYCEAKATRFESYAARFAAKEAGMKALGTGWSNGVRWRDIEVVRPKGQRPTLQLHGQAAAIAAKLGSKHIALSLTHTSEEALAHVILEN